MADGSALMNNLSNWNPENAETWSSRRAWLTLSVTTYSMVVAFCVWFLVAAIAPKLNAIGFALTRSQLYWLTAIPGLSGGLFRLLYMFLPPILGTRKLVGLSSALFIIPLVGWFFAVQDHGTPYWVLLALAFACGIGGGSFSGYMPSTGYFFPKRLSGTALGTQAGIGNFGMSLVQLLGPWVIGLSLLGAAFFPPVTTADGRTLSLHNAPLVLVPWALVAIVFALTLLRDVPIKANVRQQLDIFNNRNTWFLTAIYLMTFGAFSGFSAQLALLINDTFGETSEFAGRAGLPDGTKYGFLGPLIASAVRVAWGPLCDRFGGGLWTLVSGVGMTLSIGVAATHLTPTSPGEFHRFLWAMIAMFFFAGIGNAGTFKLMPMIMPPRQAGGAIGFTAAIAAFGPFIVGVALSTLPAAGFFWGCCVYFLACTTLVWVMYARPRAPSPG
jgi:MFS transporter, NNP family, nitrate/nitrite transporter